MFGGDPGLSQESDGDAKFTGTVVKYVLNPSKTIHGGMSKPQDFTVASDGTIYVTNLKSDSVTAYTRSDGIYHQNPDLGVDQNLVDPTGVSVDHDTGIVYVASYGTNKILAFRKRYGKLVPEPSMNITEGLNGPYEFHIDRDMLYVANFNTNEIIVFKRDASGKYVLLPELAIKNGIQQPISVTSMDGGKKVYVTNFGANTVGAYNKTPEGYVLAESQTLSKGLMGPYSITHDPEGNLYVADFNTSAVAVFVPNKKGIYELDITKSLVDGLNGANAVLFSKDYVEMYVLNYNNNTISVFNKKEVTVTKQMLAKIKRTLFPAVPHARQTGKIIQKIPDYTMMPDQTISGGMKDSQHMAFDAEGNLYVVNMTRNNVTVYQKDENGRYGYRPEMTITGGMNTPTGILIDRDGDMMVMNYIGNDITVYRKNKNGRYLQDISKTITNGIEGPSTGCFDESGVMYISNFNVNAIGVFCKRDGRYWTDEGRTITGNLIKPNAIGIDEEGVMYVTGYGGRYIWAFTRNSEGHSEFDGKKNHPGQVDRLLFPSNS